ncbi:hypothetical protein [Slackia heliotrinireducens]|uniref:hypothetical protein n=1 Tax=Slackia heliotrinireducens TaxID=84110 RepID=UPI0033153251
MLQQDYLMRLIIQFVAATTRSIEIGKVRPKEAAEGLEDAMSEALDMDASTLLRLEPESLSDILRVSGVDPDLMEYIIRSMLLEAWYLEEANLPKTGQLRRDQARALAYMYGLEDTLDFDIPVEDLETELRRLAEGDGIDFDAPWSDD